MNPEQFDALVEGRDGACFELTEADAKARRQRQKLLNYAFAYSASPARLAEIQASLGPWKGAPKGSRQQRRLARTRRMQWHRRRVTAEPAPILDWTKV